jgi:hypothetical protein
MRRMPHGQRPQGRKIQFLTLFVGTSTVELVLGHHAQTWRSDQRFCHAFARLLFLMTGQWQFLTQRLMRLLSVSPSSVGENGDTCAPEVDRCVAWTPSALPHATGCSLVCRAHGLWKIPIHVGAAQPTRLEIGLIGDLSHSTEDKAKFHHLVQAMPESNLAFVIHVGAIEWCPRDYKAN